MENLEYQKEVIMDTNKQNDQSKLRNVTETPQEVVVGETDNKKEAQEKTMIKELKTNQGKPNQGKANQQNQASKKQKSHVAENHHRINYLVQVSRVLATMPDSGQESEAKCAGPGHRVGMAELASQAGALASGIGRRCVMRLDPGLKRGLCKGCGVALVYGVNAKVRHRGKRQKHLVVTCLTCRTIKRFLNRPGYTLWCEKDEALA